MPSVIRGGKIPTWVYRWVKLVCECQLKMAGTGTSVSLGSGLERQWLGKILPMDRASPGPLRVEGEMVRNYNLYKLPGSGEWTR